LAPIFRPIRGRARELIAASSAAFLVATILVCALFSAAAQAAPGGLDPTFSADGKQTTDFDFASGRAAATVIQPDGKIVAVGDVPFMGYGVLARYNPNGSLDTTFSGDGKQRTDFGAAAVAIQGNGKIVVLGGGTLARFNPNGSLDTTFSGDGEQTTGFGIGSGVAIQGDGKIVVAGGSLNGSDFDFALARYNPNGSLDTTFSGDGKQTTTFGGGLDQANGVAIQANGRIVAAGVASGGATGKDFALARYNPSGSLDPSFSGDGKQRTDFGFAADDQASGVVLQAGGKIVAAGSAGGGATGGDFALARYNPNGLLDTSFSADGKRRTDFGGYEEAHGVTLQGDGRLVVVGYGAGLALARYNPNGSLDTTFSGDGKQTGDGDFGAGTGVAIQPFGKIVVVGDGGFALARYNLNGSLDTSFSGDGNQRTSFPGFDEATGVALQGDGKIVAAGGTGDNYQESVDFALARYNPNGSLDTSFSGDGRRTTNFGNWEEASGVALQADGKIVVVGRTGGCGCTTTPHPADDFALARYNPNGSLDTTFSGDGKQTTTFRPHTEVDDDFDIPTAVALQADGKIVVVGQSFTFDSDSDFALARYNPNGSLDTTFSGDGKLLTDFGGYDQANGVALQGDGTIVVVGSGAGGFELARYNPDGTLDASFSGDGKQTTGGGFGGANGVALQGDGKLVAAGSASGGATGVDFALARYNPDGSLDTGFSADGKQRTNFRQYDPLRGIALQADGRIVAAGSSFNSSAAFSDFALARYNADGSLDTSFSGDGKQLTDLGGYDAAIAVDLQADGKIVAAGFGPGAYGTTDFALVRFLGN
jgi:uncharacterized delta-60 repeat protein